MQNAVYKSLLFTISLFTIGSLYAQGGDYIDGPNSGTCNSCFPSIANDPTTREFIDDNDGILMVLSETPPKVPIVLAKTLT